MFCRIFDGPTLEEERTQKEFDMHCPQMGPGLNYYKSKCEERQKNPTLDRTCYPECQDAKLKRAQANAKKTGNEKNGNIKKVIDLIKGGMTVGDVAKKLGIKSGTVSRYKHIAKKEGLLT